MIFLCKNNPSIDFSSYKVIVVVNEHLLGKVTRILINAGFKNILLELLSFLHFLFHHTFIRVNQSSSASSCVKKETPLSFGQTGRNVDRKICQVNEK